MSTWKDVEFTKPLFPLEILNRNSKAYQDHSTHHSHRENTNTFCIATGIKGDSDTLTCIAGSIAEGYYGVPEELKQECRRRLPEYLSKVLKRIDQAWYTVA